MKRAILITTGTVVGITSVLAYKPNTDALALVPGTESLTASASVRTAAAQGTQTADAASSAATAEPTPEFATTSAAAKPTTATGADKPSARATATAQATASATPSSSASTPSSTTTEAVSDGTHTGSSEIVESHGRTYGSLIATVTVSNGKLTDLSFEQTPAGRNEQFISAVNTYLVPEILRTQNVTVGIVTGATGTSMALIASLQSALGLA